MACLCSQTRALSVLFSFDCTPICDVYNKSHILGASVALSLVVQVMPYSTGCTTPLSNFEAGLNYKDVPDPAVKVSFPLDDDEDSAEMVIWTTTPW